MTLPVGTRQYWVFANDSLICSMTSDEKAVSAAFTYQRRHDDTSQICVTDGTTTILNLPPKRHTHHDTIEYAFESTGFLKGL